MTASAPEPLDPIAVEQALADDLAAITDAQTRLLVAAWALAWSEISSELLDVLSDLIADGVAITTATIARFPRLASALATIADRLDDLCADAGVTITADLAGVVDQAVAGQIELMRTQVLRVGDRPANPDQGDNDGGGETAAQRVDRLDIERRPRRTALDAIIDRFSDRIVSGLDPVPAETYEIIQRELVRGIVVGDNPRTTARRMVDRAEGDFDLALQRALTIARTETLDAYRDAAGAQQAEHADILAGWVWLAHLSARTCRSCVSMHGEVFALDVPGPRDHQQGRCSRCPVVREDDGSVDLSWVPDADEFVASLSEDEQRAMLGRRGYAAWSAGDFPRDQWTKTRSSEGWRDAQVPASPGDAAGGSGRGGTGGGAGGGDGSGRDDGPVLPIDAAFDYDGELRSPGTLQRLTPDQLVELGLLRGSLGPLR